MYVDDTQIYSSFPTTEISSATQKIAKELNQYTHLLYIIRRFWIRWIPNRRMRDITIYYSEM